MKMTLIYMKINLLENGYEWFCTKTCFDTEAEGNSEMAYCLCYTTAIGHSRILVIGMNLACNGGLCGGIIIIKKRSKSFAFLAQKTPRIHVS